MNASTRFMRCFCLYVFFFAIYTNVKADHLAAGDLTYKCLGGQKYEFTFTMYRDCDGAKGNAGNVILNSTTCGTATCPLTEISRTEVAYPCPTAKTNCSGGTVKGLEAVVFRGTVTLPGNCTNWTMKFHDSNRNNAITTIPGGAFGTGGSIGLTVMDSMFNVACNNSPVFINKPVMYACVGQKFCFSAGAIDPDGDSLVYFLSPPLSIGTGTTNNGQVIYNPGYSYTNFVSSSTPITLDRATGEVCFTPTMTEVTILAIRINEYRKGVKIGSTERDMQLWVINCNNNLPTASGINGTNTYSIAACAGSQLCFTFNTNDSDAADHVTATANQLVPGSTLSFAGSPHPVGTFCWTPSAADVKGTPYLLSLVINDDHCPLQGTQNVSYSIYVKNCSAITADVTGAPVCADSCYTLSAKPTGGTAPYTYSWSPGINTASTFKVCPSTTTIYTVTITDSKGVKATDTAQVKIYPAINLAAATTLAQCGISNGNATVSVTGGTGPFTYQWFPVINISPTLSNIAAGSYTATVTDSKGCKKIITVNVPGSPGLTAQISGSNPLCSGSSTTLLASGGSVFVWNTGASTSSIVVAPSSTTSYSVTVKDANGCTGTATTTVSTPAAMTSTVSVVHTACGTSTGSASVSAGGGTGVLSYSWNPGGQNTPVISNLGAGNYTCTITDANGCTHIQTAGISNTNGPAATIALQVDVSCNGGKDGSAGSSVTGGTAPYEFSWSSGQTTQNISGLSAGNYSITVTDASGCSDTKIVTITQPAPILASVSILQASCSQSDGSATVNPSGGTAPYTYLWNTFQTGKTATGLAAGNYSVMVTDAKGCSKSFTASITNPGGPNIIAGTNAVIAPGGSVNLTASGGISYVWSPVNGLSCVSCTNPVASPLQTTRYCVVVRDANQCVDSACVTISVEEPCINSYYLPNAFSPNADAENDVLRVYFVNHSCVKEYLLRIYDRWGEKVFESADAEEGWDGRKGSYNAGEMNTQVVGYYLHIEFTDGTRIDKHGNVSLIK